MKKLKQRMKPLREYTCEHTEKCFRSYNKIKDEKGSMTLFVIVAFIFCMTLLINLYLSSSNYQVSVLQAEQAIRNTYEQDVKNMDKIHSDLINGRK